MDGLSARLQERGYCRVAATEKLRLVGRMSLWLGAQQLGLDSLDREIVSRFLATCPPERIARRGGRRTMHILLEYLSDIGAVALAGREREAEEMTEIERLVSSFGRYLTEERALSAATLQNYPPLARRFLEERFPGEEPLPLAAISGGDITAFVQRHARDLGAGRAKLMVTALRSFFRFLRFRGDVTTDLAACVPTVADWRLAGLPKYITADEIERLLASCDRRTAVGARDFAILLLLSRLGLRAGEVAGLRLEHIDWANGEFSVRGKGGRCGRLPLPMDVGEAIAAYLREGRPVCSCRQVFVRVRAPWVGFTTSGAVSDVVRHALQRAGLHPPHRGAHLLRHSVATHMLRQGAKLSEIGELLRHRSPDTTAIYAKVDVASLRRLAQPWPEVQGE